MSTVKQVSPWQEMFERYNVLFGKDPDIKLKLDNDVPAIKMYVDDEMKFGALAKLLPAEYDFGSVKLKVELHCSNGNGGTETIIRDAFFGNPIVSDVVVGSNPMTQDDVFVVFDAEVVQYHNDDLMNLFGIRTTVYEEVAREVFNYPGVHFNTERVEE